jgi:hypothetical protein
MEQQTLNVNAFAIEITRNGVKKTLYLQKKKDNPLIFLEFENF